MGVLLFATVLLGAVSFADSGGGPSGRVLDLKTLKSPSGRFTAIGHDHLANIAVMRWADDLTDRMEKATGVAIPFGQIDCRLVVREAGMSPPENLEDPRKSGTNLVQVIQQWSGNRLIQRFIVPPDIRLDRETVEELFCRMLFSGYILVRRSGTPVPEAAEDGSKALSEIPEWIPVGVVQNLYPSLKVRNSEKILDLWEGGRLLPLTMLLQPDILQSLPPEDYRAIAGMLVGWILSFPDRKTGIPELLDSITLKVSFPGWLMFRIPEARSVSDLNHAWDLWILRQKRIVYAPGLITPRMVRQLKSEVLLYPDKLDISLPDVQNRRITFREWIEHREAGWTSGIAKQKINDLRRLAIGRGPEFGAVVESYVVFLNALAGKKSSRRLEELLDKAEDALAGLKQKSVEDEPARSPGP